MKQTKNKEGVTKLQFGTKSALLLPDSTASQIAYSKSNMSICDAIDPTAKSSNLASKASFAPPSINSLLRLVFVLFIAVASYQPLCAAAPKHGYGLPLLTQDEFDHIESHWPKIVGVKPNKIGAARIRHYLQQEGKDCEAISYAHSHHDEFITPKNTYHPRIAELKGWGKRERPSRDSKLSANDVAAPAAPAAPPLPRSVDNSTRLSFPPIGNQGSEGSCVAWASTYYQASHEIGLLNGHNNKASFNGVLSPKWTYNILNNGEDGGLNVIDAYELLAQNGAVSIVNFPYDGNYLSW